ncbi:MAG: NADH-quinone oxidoreductase subunit N [Gammaproteobacteria bacterium]|nr:NADH-quinone oxidoreductase subunit N [Gammaproteobacteria bacterium]
MLSLSRSFILTLPVIAVFFTAIFVMLIDLFKPKSWLPNIFVYIGLGIAAVLAIIELPAYQVSTWSNLFISDNVSYLMQFFIVLVVFLAIYFSSARLKHMDSERGDILSLYLFSAMGMMLLVSVQSMLSMYVCLELTSLPLYALVASQRKDGLAVEAAVKYFVMGALASVFILFGMSLLYGLTGNLDLDQIANALTVDQTQSQLMLTFAIIFIIAGASFKLALVPFHMWIPDVYVGAHPVMTLFLSAAPKIAGLAIFLRLSMFGIFDVFQFSSHLFALIGLTSIIFANLNALVQKDLRRLLAYSTISHMGYAILGFVAGGQIGQTASLFYILIYSLMTTAAFAAIILARKENIVLFQIDNLKGLGKRCPWLAVMLLIVFFSMAGVPPAIGFLAKFLVIRALVNTGHVYVASFALIFAVVGAFYYLRLIKTMYFEVPEQEEAIPFEVQPMKRMIYIVNAGALLVLGLFPNMLVTLCSQSF